GLSGSLYRCCARESKLWSRAESGFAETMSKQKLQPVVLTIGHSTRPLAVFIGLLAAHPVTRLIHVRTVLRSRHNPQFDLEILPAALEAVGIDYAHTPGLGGFRRTGPESANMGWRNASFRAYAEHVQTAEIAQNLAPVTKLAKQERAALMCAEAPWRCHRSLIADALVVHGIRADEITSLTRCQHHVLTPFADVQGTAITYPPLAAPEPGAANSRK
ncbi:MAG TPA: DUF488 domain-containing protein, partial [Rhodocyclaceae bacterium]|nr:DUF488 domain-containing protein [Rhodocyclaceae bacterium]